MRVIEKDEEILTALFPVEKVEVTKKDIENARSRMVGWVHSLARSGR